jgi:hypothetical protein
MVSKKNDMEKDPEWPTIMMLGEVSGMTYRPPTDRDLAYAPPGLSLPTLSVPWTTDITKATCLISLRSFTRVAPEDDVSTYRAALLLIQSQGSVLPFIDLLETESYDIHAPSPTLDGLIEAANNRVVVTRELTIRVSSQNVEYGKMECSVPEATLTQITEELQELGVTVGQKKPFRIKTADGFDYSIIERVTAAVTRYAYSPFQLWVPSSILEEGARSAPVVRILVEASPEPRQLKVKNLPCIGSANRQVRDNPGGIVATVHSPKGAGKSTFIESGALDAWTVLYDSDFFYDFTINSYREYPYNLQSDEALDQYFSDVAEAYSGWASSIATTVGQDARLSFVHYRAELESHHPTGGFQFVLISTMSPYVALQLREGLPVNISSRNRLPYGWIESVKDWEKSVHADGIVHVTLQDLVELGLWLSDIMRH